MFNRLRFAGVFAVIAIAAFLQLSEAQTLAFPGAEGFGRFTKGGRGGRIIEVTNLNNAGPGSFRDAVTAQGPRIIVFRVGGAIELTGATQMQKDIYINYPYVTIAGQTAPGGGITINGGGLFFRTGEVIVRHIRIRVGNPSSESNTGALMIWSPDPTYHNNDNTLWSENAMIDHVSAGWSSDDNIGIWGRARNVFNGPSVRSPWEPC